ncbi:MAG: hypothetical protein HYU58_06770 [Proteobacteria bacterium]|nr:hypothetical protein [Pseudomonadota bacterium]
MKRKWSLPMIALAALVAGSGAATAQTQNNSPTDPTAPGGGTCTGFPGDPANCPRQDQPNTTIPEQTDEPDINTQTGPTNQQTTPDENNQQQQPNGASPNNGAANPTPQQ